MVKWIVDKYMVDTTTDIDIVGELDRLGIQYVVLEYNPALARDELENPFQDDDCPVLIYGSVRFVKHFCKLPVTPGAYYNLDAMTCASFTTNISNKSLLLNEKHIFLTFDGLKNQKDTVYGFFGGKQETIFVRPNSTAKIFTGLPIKKSEFESEVSSLEQLSSVVPETMVMVSDTKRILAEFRFFIVNREVITGTQYKELDNIVSRPHVSMYALKVAEEMAKNKWQPDIAYVCDVAVLDNGDVKIVELNPISSSGLYSCDFPKLVVAMNEAATLEYNGELFLGE